MTVFLLTFSFFKYLGKIGATPIACKSFIDKFTPIRDELIDVIAFPENEDLQEGYDTYTFDQIEEIAAVYQMIIEDCERFAKIGKTLRKARKKKPIKKEKLLKTFKYLEKDDTFKVASIDPGIIIGAVELWTYNIKSKYLTVYRALDRAGLSVKGATIINFDEKTSMTKTVGRKADEVLKSVTLGGKIILRKIMDQINTSPKPLSGRVSKTTLLLKAM